MGWARAAVKQSPRPPTTPQRRNPLYGQPSNPSPPIPTRDPEELSAHLARHQRTAEAQPTTRDLEQAFDRLNPDYGVPRRPHNGYGRQAMQDREAAVALGTRVAVASSRENDPNPVMWLAGQDYRAADAIHRARVQRIRQWHGPERLGPER